MDYPVWISQYLAGAQLVAIIAVLHVFISHFAVGMGLYVVLAEKKPLNQITLFILTM